MRAILFLSMLVGCTGDTFAQNSRAELDSLLSNMANGSATKISAEQMAEKLKRSRDIVNEVGTREEVNAFDAQLAEAKRLEEARRATQADSTRTVAEAAERRQLAEARDARVREENRAMDWERQQAAKAARVHQSDQLPSRRTICRLENTNKDETCNTSK